MTPTIEWITDKFCSKNSNDREELEKVIDIAKRSLRGTGLRLDIGNHWLDFYTSDPLEFIDKDAVKSFLQALDVIEILKAVKDKS